MSDLKLSSYIQPSLNTESILPWTISTLYQTDQFVYFGQTLCKCISSHTSSSTSFITDYQSGKWVNINPIPLTSTQRLAITSLFEGQEVYQIDGSVGKYIYEGGVWKYEHEPLNICYRQLTTQQANINNGVKFLFNNGRFNQGNISYASGTFTVPKGKLYDITFNLNSAYSNIAATTNIAIYNGTTNIESMDTSNPALTSSTWHPCCTMNIPLDLREATVDATISVQVSTKTTGSSLTINRAEIKIIEIPTNA